MCGIAGVVGRFDEPVVSRMLRAQAHRGPDGTGVWGNERAAVTLGHSRLSIIDTSASGRQPMFYGNGRLCITYNGEIYNYQDLRAELLEEGWSFQTQSDTEVILAAYAAWGRRALSRLHGMFAFVLVDLQPSGDDPNVVMARDRLGIKPLLYRRHNGSFYFASEMRAFLALDGFTRTANTHALRDYLSVGAVYQPRTIIDGVHSVPPGHYFEIRERGASIVRYWDLHEATSSSRRDLVRVSRDDAVSDLSNKLGQAVRRAKVADVEVGAFLSGGIDSTVVTGVMASLSDRPVKTFTVGFESQFAGLDERAYARTAAEHLGCDHHEVVVRAADAAELFHDFVSSVDQPSCDGMNTWLVSRSTSKYVKVALSGLGGDEVFAGYPHFHSMHADEGSSFDNSPGLYKVAQALHARRPNRYTLRLLARFSNTAGRMSGLRRVFDDSQLLRATLSPIRDESGQHLWALHRELLRPDADVVQQVSYSEARTYLQGTLLRDADVMSMAHGLEVRPVLLDHELVEYVYSLPLGLKLTPAQPKRLLIDAAGGIVPEALRQRSKMGFELPYMSWIRGPLSSTVSALLDGRYARMLFAPHYLRKQRYLLSRNEGASSLWAVAVLLAWMEKHNVDLQTT